MQPILGIRNARLRGRRDAVDIRWTDDGRIDRVAARIPFPRGARTFDADGGLVLPSFVDPHLHLDLAYTCDEVPPNRSGTLLEAIRLWSRHKRQITAAQVERRAACAIEEEIAFGTGFIRTHVDVATASGLRLCEGVLAARQRFRDRIDIQVAAFPQDGILRDPGAFEQMRTAMKLGCDVVGGIAHNERTAEDSIRHVGLLFDLAEEFDAPIDCHIDETDDPLSLCTEHFAAEAIRRGFGGRITASHVCALGSYDNAHARRVINLLLESEAFVVTNPCVNLHLQGRFDGYPKRRGLTRVKQLLSEGVTVAAGQDCIKDPFYPLGTGQMLEVAHMLVHADHLSTEREMGLALDAVTGNAARVLGVRHYGVAAGRRADLVVLPVSDGPEALRIRPRPRLVVKSGRTVHLDPVARSSMAR